MEQVIMAYFSDISWYICIAIASLEELIKIAYKGLNNKEVLLIQNMQYIDADSKILDGK